MNIPKIEEAITLLYQTYIEDQDVATQRGIAITAMNEMVKLLGGEDVVEKIEAVSYSARLRAQHLFEDEPQQRTWVGLTEDELYHIATFGNEWGGAFGDFQWQSDLVPFVRALEAKLKEKNNG